MSVVSEIEISIIRVYFDQTDDDVSVIRSAIVKIQTSIFVQ